MTTSEEEDGARGIAEWYASEARRKDRMARVARQTGATAYVPSEGEGEFFRELQRSLGKPDPTQNAFCPTGESGGIDNSCSPLWVSPTFVREAIKKCKGDVCQIGVEIAKSYAASESDYADVWTGAQHVFDQSTMEGRPYTLREDKHEEYVKKLVKHYSTGKHRGSAEHSETLNAFCPTGPGGGIDNSCPPSKEGRQGWPEFPVEGHVTETPEFRRWFAGSKVVDEHGAPKDTAPIRGVRDGYGGEPIVVYHGTPRGPFDEFRADKIADPDHLHFGPGFYFTEDVKAAEQFAKGGHSAAATGDNPTVMTYYLRSLNPFDADTMSIDPSKLPASERALARAALVQKTYAEEGRSEAVAKGKEFDRGEVRVRYRDLTTDRGVGGFGLDKYAVRDYLKALGHDSLTTRMHDVGRPGANRYWVIFEPTQVKSTGNRGAFDPADPNVRNVLADLAREFQ